MHLVLFKIDGFLNRITAFALYGWVTRYKMVYFFWRQWVSSMAYMPRLSPLLSVGFCLVLLFPFIKGIVGGFDEFWELTFSFSFNSAFSFLKRISTFFNSAFSSLKMTTSFFNSNISFFKSEIAGSSLN